jgi:putative redox protein
VGTALVSCILTIMAMAAERHGIALEGSTARVEKTMTTSGVRRIAALEVWITLPAALDEEQRRLLQRAAAGCPVKRSLQEAVPIELHWS